MLMQSFLEKMPFVNAAGAIKVKLANALLLSARIAAKAKARRSTLCVARSLQ